MSVYDFIVMAKPPNASFEKHVERRSDAGGNDCVSTARDGKLEFDFGREGPDLASAFADVLATGATITHVVDSH